MSHNDPVDDLVGDLHDLAKPSKALPPEINAALTRALADAWDEGHAAGCDDSYAQWGECGCGPNPYRQEKS